MSIFSILRDHLGEHVGQADLRLFEAILAHAPSDLDANPPTLHLNKAQVLAALREIEGKDVSPEVVRSRIKNLNKAFTAIGRADYGLVRSRYDYQFAEGQYCSEAVFSR